MAKSTVSRYCDIVNGIFLGAGSKPPPPTSVSQLQHATYTPHPGPQVPEHDGWYFDGGEQATTKLNQGGSVDDSFKVGALISAGAG